MGGGMGGKMKEWPSERDGDEKKKKVGRTRGKKKKARDSSVVVSHAWPSIFNEAKVNVFSCSFTHSRNPNHAPS